MEVINRLARAIYQATTQITGDQTKFEDLETCHKQMLMLQAKVAHAEIATNEHANFGCDGCAALMVTDGTYPESCKLCSRYYMDNFKIG